MGLGLDPKVGDEGSFSRTVRRFVSLSRDEVGAPMAEGVKGIWLLSI